MRLSFQRYDFELVFQENIFAGLRTVSTLRSIMGMNLKYMCCIAKKSSCDECLYSKTCAYATLFESFISKDNEILFGRDKASHPYVLSLAGEIGCRSETLGFSLTLLGKYDEYFPYIYGAFSNAGKRGFGKDRIPFCVSDMTVDGESVFERGEKIKSDLKQKTWELSRDEAVAGGEIHITLKTPLRYKIEKQMQKGKKVVVFDEITRAEDFITDSAYLPDVYAKYGVKILLSGTDTLGFIFATNRELYNRLKLVNTTHISYAEHCRVLGTASMDDYKSYGGLMARNKDDVEVKDFESAKTYLDSAVAANISWSVSHNGMSAHLSNLNKMSLPEICCAIEKIVELYSGQIDEKVVKNELKSAVLTSASKKKVDDPSLFSVFKKIRKDRKDLTKEFAEEINAAEEIKTNVTPEMVDEFKYCLYKMNVLSVVDSRNLENINGKWEQFREDDYYIIQPAIKYYHMKKSMEFLDKNPEFFSLPVDVIDDAKEYLQEQIMGNMTEQITLFDTKKKSGRRWK